MEEQGLSREETLSADPSLPYWNAVPTLLDVQMHLSKIRNLDFYQKYPELHNLN